MKVYWISFVNAILLMVLGAWAYLVSDTPSLTALIPVFAGVLLLALNPGLKKEKKLEAHLAVLLTLLVTIGLFKPLLAAWGRARSEEHTSELQSRPHLVCRLLLEKKKHERA